MSVKNLLMELLIFLPLTGLIWFSFVKAYDAQLLVDEQEKQIEGGN